MLEPSNLEEVLIQIGGEALAAEMVRFQADLECFDTQYEDFQKRYPNCFVAVYEGKVVGWGKDSHQLIYRLRRRGQPVHKVVIKKVYKVGEEPVWILPVAA
ncbi:MAG: hypothetical protein A2Z11_03360 [Candidatus Woykebacteria bacterium RBG_16_43_9]|uniref:DUF5678 domain-containing protein n=1 Tax=Candidatus Woykebacteria bacterium RBG_16_43_9 TaxID=1802596 RepID=A0A1G1WHB0_9BACT|nr:MAG: hypothetical protein A2Z11_03360 [Candidatus Woykebacteria bacterium RBG_16_43_9]